MVVWGFEPGSQANQTADLVARDGGGLVLAYHRQRGKMRSRHAQNSADEILVCVCVCV